MARYIDADAFSETLQQSYDDATMRGAHEMALAFYLVIDALNGHPTADVAPMLHGRWVKRNNGAAYWYACSECGHDVPKTTWKQDWYSAYCPFCGAKMDGGEDDE